MEHFDFCQIWSLLNFLVFPKMPLHAYCDAWMMHWGAFYTFSWLKLPRKKPKKETLVIPQLWPEGRDILPQDTRARRRRLWWRLWLWDDWFNHHHDDRMARRVDTEKRYGDESARERVRTHHHSDVLGQVPGAPLEEIRERRLNTHTQPHTQTDVGRQRERKPINESQFVAFASLKKRKKKLPPAGPLPSRLPHIIY